MESNVEIMKKKLKLLNIWDFIFFPKIVEWQFTTEVLYTDQIFNTGSLNQENLKVLYTKKNVQHRLFIPRNFTEKKLVSKSVVIIALELKVIQYLKRSELN